MNNKNGQNNNNENNKNDNNDINKNYDIDNNNNDKNKKLNTSNNNNSSVEVYNESNSQKSGIKVCKICLFDNEDKENVMISPCECSGSMKYVHANCLRIWMSNKVSVKSNDTCTSINWKKYECEICKSAFPNI
jgi:hypothetical protein